MKRLAASSCSSDPRTAKPWAALGRLFAAGVLALSLAACTWRHQIIKTPSPDGTFVLIIDYIKKPFGTQDVVVSLEEKRGLASEIASFGNIQSFNAGWLGPEDIGICQVGNVQTYRTHLTINAHNGNQDFYIHYKCPLS
jgi:hypothetical protein